MATFDKQQLRSPATPAKERIPIYKQQLRSPATTPAKERSPATPTRETTWQRQAMAAVVARSPSKATPPRSRSARQRHEAKNGDVVARTTRELGQATGEAARALRTERAAAYASTGAFDAALADLAAALALSKNGARASIHFLRGEVFSKIERSEEAIQAYSACLAENPSHAKAAYRRAACRNPLDARAADDYEAALALDATPDTGAPSPSHRRPSLRLGVDAYAAKLEEDAAKGHFRAHFDRAYAYDASNDLPNAISEYSAAIKVLPAHALAWYNRGICRERLGDAAAALDDFTQAIQRAEASARETYPLADFYHNRAFCRRKLADFSGAVDDYSLALTRDPSHFKALYNRAFCLDALGRRQEALRDYEAALAVEPRNPSAHHNRGVVLEKLGRLEDAVEAFDTAVDCGMPPDAEYHHARGTNARHRGDHATAVAAFSAALKLDPRHRTARANRAYARRKIGDFVGARRDYGKALADAPTAKLYNARAYCSAKLEKFDAAVADYTEALRLDPANAHALHNRGISYDRLGRDDEAARDLERALEIEGS
jgi:tetratricopeptide (TPR) repeat protein